MVIIRLVLGLTLLLAIAASVLVAGHQAGADTATTTFCVERPIAFNPQFRPSGCFTYKPIDGGMTIIGRALTDSGFLPRGGTVEARIGDTVCGSTTVAAATGLYILNVEGASDREGCGSTGERIEFYVEGQLARQTLLWSTATNDDPEFLALNALSESAWYWFERLTLPPPRPGIPIEAYTNGTLCGETRLGDEGDALGAHVRENLRGFVRLAVTPGEGSCAQPGTTVEFRVGGLRGETVVPWEPNVQRINLMVQGDANCDFLVDARDATLDLQFAARLTKTIVCHGDADHSGRIDAFDAQQVLQFAAGLTDDLPA